MTPKRVLITRALDAAKSSEKNVAAQNHIPIVFPLFEIVRLDEAPPEESFDGIIFTSRNAVQSISNGGFDPQNILGNAWCVGAKTAQLAKEKGYQRIHLADGNAKSLAEAIIAQGPQTGRRLFYPTTRTPSFDMAEILTGSGFEIVQTVVYEQRTIFPERSALDQLIAEKEPDTVLIHSKRSGLHTSRVLFETEGFEPPALSAITISPQCSDSLLKYPWANVYSAATPTEAAMLDLISAHGGSF